MSEPSDSDMILATSCPHCGTECEFDLPAEATTNAELAGQIRVVCHGCEEMFQPVGDAIAGSEDIADALDQQALTDVRLAKHPVGSFWRSGNKNPHQ